MDFEKFNFPYFQERQMWDTFPSIASAAKLLLLRVGKTLDTHMKIWDFASINRVRLDERPTGSEHVCRELEQKQPQQWGRMVGPLGQQTQLEQSHAKKGAWKGYWHLRKVEETRGAPQSSRIQLLSKLWSIYKDGCTESGASILVLPNTRVLEHATSVFRLSFLPCSVARQMCFVVLL